MYIWKTCGIECCGFLLAIEMNKRKLQSFYIFIGILTLVLVNYPIVDHILEMKTGKAPAILIYLLIVGMVVSLIGFILEKKNR